MDNSTMPQFRRLGLEDRDTFLKHLGDYPFKTYEYSFTTLYLWRKYLDVRFGLHRGALIVQKCDKRSGAYFMQPIGYSPADLAAIIADLRAAKASHPDMQYLFRDVEEGFLDQLKSIYGAGVIFSEDVDNFDYIYESAELISLAGKLLHTKKNHYNKFIRTYPHSTKDMREPGVISDCLDFARTWYVNHNETSDQLRAEQAGIRDILSNFYLGLDGMAVYVDDKIVGFTIGEQVNSDMAIIHIEKADPRYSGVYAYVNKTFIETYYSDVRYINREEDLGLEGLRTAKASYHPVRLEKKYLVNIV